ncbi:unnamed protein product [Rhodiola kirilowii]
MPKRDPLRPYMDVIDNMLTKMFREDPSFKPQGGRLGENDMDYDADEKSMATLRRHLRRAREEYYRCKSEYMTCVKEALELEDTIRNYERRDSTGWKYISTLKSARTGKLASFLDTIEYIWKCILKRQLQKLMAVVLGCMSAAILLAEATLLTNGVDLSLFSVLIKYVKNQEVLVQVLAFAPLMYMCICTYYSLFKIGMLVFYSLTPRQTSSVSLLMICSMVARYAPPISYNFLNLISLEGKHTIFEKRMGNIDQAVPFFGTGFNRIYPLIMVIYTLLVAGNFFDRVIEYFGNWNIFKFQTDVDDSDGFDPSGLIILQKERMWLEEGRKVGEHVIPLARNFNNMDMESGSSVKDRAAIDMTANPSRPRRDETNKLGNSREAISNKYAAIREQIRQSATSRPTEKSIASAKVSLLDPPTSGLSSTWTSVKTGFSSFKSNMGSKKLIPLRETNYTNLSEGSSSESLDDIFQRLKRPSIDTNRNDYDHHVGLDDDINDNK